MLEEEDFRYTLRPGEPHPSAYDSQLYMGLRLSSSMQEAIASCAIEGNRNAQVCLGTLQRIRANKPVSDRYILGLAWMVAVLSGDIKLDES